MTDDLHPRSFSDMCKKDSNPEEDYKELQSLMDKKGWDIQSIKNLFSNKVDKLCGYGIAKFVRGERTEDFQEVFSKLKKQGVSKEDLAERLGKGRAKMGMFEGDMENGELEIGQVTAMIDTIKPAAEIVKEIWNDFQAGVDHLKSLPFSRSF